MSGDSGMAAPAQDTLEQPAARNGAMAWLRRLGVAGFLFFLIKGMLWLIVPAAIMWWRSAAGGE